MRRHLIKPAQSDMADARALQLETAKQILSEVFHARPSDVEDMIMRRLEERGRLAEKSWIKESRRIAVLGTWPEMFQVDGKIKI